MQLFFLYLCYLRCSLALCLLSFSLHLAVVTLPFGINRDLADSTQQRIAFFIAVRQGYASTAHKFVDYIKIVQLVLSHSALELVPACSKPRRCVQTCVATFDSRCEH